VVTAIPRRGRLRQGVPPAWRGLKRQDAGGGGVCFRDPALRGEGRRQRHVHYAEPGVALGGATRRVRRFVKAAVHVMSGECPPRPGSYLRKQAELQSGSRFT
jgi:hypothetical protein